MSNLIEKLSEFNELELKKLVKPIENETISTVVSFEANSLEKGLEAEIATYYLHVSVKRTCYVVYSKYQYKAFTSTDKKGKKKIKVDKIKMKMNSGNGIFTKSQKNTSQVKKLDEVYGTGNTCKKAKLLATATIGDQSWDAQV